MCVCVRTCMQTCANVYVCVCARAPIYHGDQRKNGPALVLTCSQWLEKAEQVRLHMPRLSADQRQDWRARGEKDGAPKSTGGDDTCPTTQQPHSAVGTIKTVHVFGNKPPRALQKVRLMISTKGAKLSQDDTFQDPWHLGVPGPVHSGDGRAFKTYITVTWDL